MKRLLILAVITITCIINVMGQNLVFIKERSFPSTEIFLLKSNTDYIGDLKMVFARDGEERLLVLSSKLVGTVRISGKLTVYLDNGSVVTCVDKDIKDNMDDVAITAYYLTNDDINKLEESNINTIRYVVKCEECVSNPLYEGNYTASNKGSSKTDFTSVAIRFFNQTIEQPYKPQIKESETERKDYITNIPSGFSLTGRSLSGALPLPGYSVQESGVIVVAITVDKYGNVVSAEYQLKGSTSQNATLKASAIKAAQQAKFNSDRNAPTFQKGTITYHFELN